MYWHKVWVERFSFVFTVYVTYVKENQKCILRRENIIHVCICRERLKSVIKPLEIKHCLKTCYNFVWPCYAKCTMCVLNHPPPSQIWKMALRRCAMCLGENKAKVSKNPRGASNFEPTKNLFTHTVEKTATTTMIYYLEKRRLETWQGRKLDSLSSFGIWRIELLLEYI